MGRHFPSVFEETAVKGTSAVSVMSAHTRYKIMAQMLGGGGGFVGLVLIDVAPRRDGGGGGMQLCGRTRPGPERGLSHLF